MLNVYLGEFKHEGNKVVIPVIVWLYVIKRPDSQVNYMLVCFDGLLLELSAPLPTLNPLATLHYIFMDTKAHTNAYLHRLKEFHFKTDMLYFINSSH